MVSSVGLTPCLVKADTTEDNTVTITLGDANPVATGNANGILLIGDDAVKGLMTDGTTYTKSGNLYTLPNGLRGYAWGGYSVPDIALGCKSLSVDYSVTKVIIYAGDNGTSEVSDYASLVETLRTKFPSAQIIAHKTDNSEVNAYLNTISGIEVVNFREQVYTTNPAETSDAKLEYEDYEAWRNKLLEHYTGSVQSVTTTSTVGDISVSLEATTDYNADTSTSITGTIGEGDSAVEFEGSSSSDSSGKSESEAEAEGEFESESTSVTEANIFNPMVTVVHSLNAKFASESADVYYIPTLADIPLDMQAFIESGSFDSSHMYHGFAAAYLGNYDIEAKTQQYSDGTAYYTTSPNTYKAGQAVRALEVLGYDFLLKEESCDIWVDDDEVKASYTTESVTDEELYLETVVMDIYKALDMCCYQYDYAFLPDSSLNPETSPLQKEISQMLGDGGTRWDTSEGSCYVFTSRTNPDLYWHKAETDQIFTTVATKYESYDMQKKTSRLTLAEYCQLLAAMMQTYGEPVMTKEEETLLLQVYGANLPTYISDDSQLEAIKYLVAKGIFNFTEKTDYNWTSPLTTEDLLSTLMAVADEDSRATFKDVQITTDAELVELGYYPIQITPETAIVSNITYNPVTSTEAYYDVLIEAFYLEGDPNDAVSLWSTQGLEYVTTDPALPYIEYLGLISMSESEFYHFRISRTVTEDSVVIKLGNKTTEQIAIQNVGGLWWDTQRAEGKQDASPSRFSFDTADASKYCANRINEYWVDSERVKAQGESSTDDGSVSAFVYLSNDDTVPILLEVPATRISDLAECTVNNVSLKPLSQGTLSVDCGTHDGVNITVSKVGNADGTSGRHVIAVSGFKTWEAFYENCELVPGSYSRSYAGFQKDNESLLVPVQFLTTTGLAGDTYSDGTKTMRLTTENNMVYIDNVNKIIVNGNSIYQAKRNSELIWKDSKGNYYVDYRAAIGWGSQYLLVNAPQEGSVSVTYNYSTTGVTTTEVSDMMTVLGYSTKLYMDKRTQPEATSMKNYLLLNSSYPSANYVVLYTNEEVDGAQNDYLVVLKPKVPYGGNSSNTLSDAAAREFIADYGFTIESEDVLVYVYKLSRTDSSANPSDIAYHSTYGYLIKGGYPGDAYENYYAQPDSDYSSGENNSLVALPFYQDSNGNWYCFNYNTFTYNGTAMPYGAVPTCYTSGNNDATDWKFITGGIALGDYSGGKTIKEINSLNTIPSASAVASCLGDALPTYTKEDVMSNRTVTVYYGAMRCVKDDNTLKIGDRECAVVTDGASFTLLRQTMTSKDVAYNLNSIITYSSVNASTMSSVERQEGLEVPLVDWEGIELATALDTADNLLTVVIAFVVNVIPRIVVYICILLIALALVTKVKPWVLFCDRFFDIYSFLTFGRKNVHTIDYRSIFFSSMVGIGIFWLFLDGTVFDVFGWIARAVVGIAIR